MQSSVAISACCLPGCGREIELRFRFSASDQTPQSGHGHGLQGSFFFRRRAAYRRDSGEWVLSFVYCVPYTDWFGLRYLRYLRLRGCVIGPRRKTGWIAIIIVIIVVLCCHGGMARWAPDGKDRRCGKRGDGSPAQQQQYTHSVDSHPACWKYRRAAEGWHARAAAV